MKILLFLFFIGCTNYVSLFEHSLAYKPVNQDRVDNNLTNSSIKKISNETTELFCSIRKSQAIDDLIHKSGSLHPLDSWLLKHTQVALSIKWNVDKYTHDIRNYYEWDIDLKEQLYILYDDLVDGRYPRYQLPLVSLQKYEGYGFTILSDVDAQKVYLSFLATALYHEIHGVFNWSILDYNSISLNTLFNWAEYLSVWNYAGTGFVPRFVININSTPASPEYLKKAFIDEYDIISTTDKQTFANILGYARDSLQHYIGNNHYDHWQYNGSTPMSKVIEGSTNLSYDMFNHWIAGCHGTVSFSKWVCFWLNIPVHDSFTGYGHRIAILPSIDSMFISHGDDPYSQESKEPNIASHHFLIDKLHFEDYFGSALSNAEQNVNVGKRVSEIALDHLPRTYLFTYCFDYYMNGNLTWDNSLWTGNTGLRNRFDTIMLDSFQFWDRLHYKISEDPNFESWGVPATEGYTPLDPISWKEFDNVVANEDSTAFSAITSAGMSGVSKTFLKPDDWVEMVIYNAAPDTWLGLSLQDSCSSLERVKYAIRISNNIITCYHNGDKVAVIEDDYNMTVNWLKLSFVNKHINFSLNGIIKHKIEVSQLSLNKYKIHFGGNGEAVEVNNIYTSAHDTDQSCSHSIVLNSTQIIDGIYKAQKFIQSNGSIPPEGKVTFLAGSEVWLDLGFTVEKKSQLEINIESCYVLE